ncbi:hypothetical protein GCM10007938_18210 [Vibrio zhanjiangensis]|uniref:Virion morphogenesis protein n=1 Tax=Vibrio zhanjiangensis TaxID=1046128 RepID=A0ABQ6EXZ6_9VIBR|nr:hypothetical protein [Vibrio zhanjiangensis]GLT18043.1 hypothetical protein GCM10007938_18210 [Vibrio zhanjiangensis]
MQPTITLNANDAISARKALEALMMTPKKRFWILKDLGRWEIRNTRSRIKRQKDTKNKAYDKRKKGEGTVLTSFANGMEPYVKNGAKDLDLTWKSRVQAKKAAVHQQGMTETVTARQHIKSQNKRFGQPDYEAQATDQQAHALRRLGYKIRRKDGGFNRLSKRNIQKRLTLGQAGLIIRMMRSGSPKGKQSWTIETPERELLGTRKELVTKRLLRNIEKAKHR